MELLGVEADHPDWPIDGISLLPWIRQANQQGATGVAAPIRRSKPIGMQWSDQTAWIDNEMKIVDVLSRGITPGQGCKMEKPYSGQTAKGPFLYNLTADPTESIDLKSKLPDLYSKMLGEARAFLASVAHSRENETHCDAKPPTPAPAPGNCTFEPDTGGFGSDRSKLTVADAGACCSACWAEPSCTVAVFYQGVCQLKDETKPRKSVAGHVACRARPTLTPLGHGRV